MNKQIKIGKITLDCKLPYVKVIRYWKEINIKDQSLNELKTTLEDLRSESKDRCFNQQTESFKAYHVNTRRIISSIIDVMENGSQTKELILF